MNKILLSVLLLFLGTSLFAQAPLKRPAKPKQQKAQMAQPKRSQESKSSSSDRVVSQQTEAARQPTEDKVEQQVQEMDLTRFSAIVVLGKDWDSGVVGLSAGKLAEKYAYPTVVLTEDAQGETCVGSARSACASRLRVSTSSA